MLLATIGLGGMPLALASSLASAVSSLPLTSALLALAGWMVLLWGAYEARGVQCSIEKPF